MSAVLAGSSCCRAGHWSDRLKRSRDIRGFFVEPGLAEPETLWDACMWLRCELALDSVREIRLDPNLICVGSRNLRQVH